MHSKHNIFVDIARYDEDTNTAYGYATTEAMDSFGTVIDLESVKACLPEYMRFANIREMHGLLAAGTTEEATVDNKGLYIAARVVDPVAQLKCREGVYKGFSIGAKKDYQIDNRIFLKSITEISLVDRPSNTECTIDAYRVFGKEQQMEEVEANPSEPEIKRYAGEEISDVQTALNALGSITWLLGWEQSEGEAHPESEEQTTQLKAAIEALKKFIVSEIKEDTAGAQDTTAEIPLLELADTDTDIERKGAELSKKNLERVQAMHDHAADMGACCRVAECNKAATGDDIQRSEADITRIQELETDITRLQSEVDTLRAENEALKAEPAPAKGVTRVVSKDDDYTRTETINTEEITDPTEAIRRIHQSGGVSITRI